MRSYSIDMGGPRDSIACQSMVGPPTRLSSEDMLITLWRCGRWQVFTALLLATVFSLHYSWSLHAHSFVGASVTYDCISNNDSIDDIMNNISSKTSTSSMRYPVRWSSSNFSCEKKSWSKLCERIEFHSKDDEMKSTIVTEWTLVCNRKQMAEDTQTLFRSGALLGSLIFPLAADRYGRKPVHILCEVMGAFAGIGLSRVTTFTQYSIVKFICGMLSEATLLTGVVWAIEFFPSKYRATGSMFLAIIWAAYWLIYMLIVYLLREWRHLQLILSMPPLIAILFAFLIPESPMWLVSKNKFYTLKKAIIRLANRINRNPFPVKIITESQEAADAVIFGSGEFSFLSAAPPNYSILDAFRCRPLRQWTFLLSLTWFLTQASLVTVTVLPSPPPMNRYLSFFANGAICIPVAVLGLPVVRQFGRRGPFFAHQIAGSVLLIIGALLPTHCPYSIKCVIVIATRYSLTFADISTLLFIPEIFPTGLRMTGLGLCSVIGGTGKLMEYFLINVHTQWLIPLILGTLMLPMSLLLLFLPETHQCSLPDVLEEVEEWAEEEGPCSSLCKRFKVEKKRQFASDEDEDDEVQDSIM